MALAPSANKQRGMLERLRTGLVLAGPDQPVLRYFERHRLARALPLHDPRNGKRLARRAWQITPAGVAAALRLAAPRTRSRARQATAEQIDIEEAIASASSGRAPECAPLTDLDAPAVPAAGVSAPEGRSSKPALAAAKPETLHA
jgi:hypothetical protein